jgi:hypothetical protein
MRLVGFDAPEISDPQCQREADLALAARNRLQAMIDIRSVTIDYVQSSSRLARHGRSALRARLRAALVQRPRCRRYPHRGRAGGALHLRTDELPAPGKELVTRSRDRQRQVPIRGVQKRFGRRYGFGLGWAPQCWPEAPKGPAVLATRRAFLFTRCLRGFRRQNGECQYRIQGIHPSGRASQRVCGESQLSADDRR